MEASLIQFYEVCLALGVNVYYHTELFRNTIETDKVLIKLQ